VKTSNLTISASTGIFRKAIMDVLVDWIGLAQDMYRWRALVNSVMNLVP
jgi:hypothetical protein